MFHLSTRRILSWDRYQNAVKAMDNKSGGFKYLKTVFAQLSDVKLKKEKDTFSKLRLPETTKMNYASAIGIDLGTTNTVAAIYVDGNPVIIPNKIGGRLTPSLVFYDPKNLQPSVGKVAEDQSLKCPKNYMFDMKRIIGRSFFDVHVQNFVKMEESKTFAIQITKSTKTNSNEVLIELESNHLSPKTIKSPEEICSETLKYIKESVNEHLGFDVSDAVISVPAYFSYAQRAATKRAASIAGFNVLKLITEPVAAAIHYTFKKAKVDENLLLFDLGGGTLDVSIITVTQNSFTVKSIEGDMFLGGRDFEEILFDYLRVEVGKRFGGLYINKESKKGQRFLHRLRKFSKKYKEMLSNLKEYTTFIDIDGDSECEITITRDMLEKLSEKLIKRIVDKVKQCLQSANMSEIDIDKVVLVGGSSRIPKIRDLLEKMFNHIELSMDMNPDEGVALGASIHAALLKHKIEKSERYKIVEMAPFTVGILAKYNLMVDFIKKGTVLPASVKQIMHTTENDQERIDFEIHEGERKNCEDNNRLGVFSIFNLPPGKAGSIDFDVKFNLDEDGLLRVSAKECSTRAKKKLNIKMQNLTLCGKVKFISLEEENRLMEQDRLFDAFYRLKLKADTLCKSLLYDLEYTDEETSLLVKKSCTDFLTYVDSLEYTELNNITVQFLAFKSKIRIIFRERERLFDVERLL